MERVRSAIIVLYVLFCEHQRIFGEEEEIRVKPGDNVTLYSDCVLPVGSLIVWIRNSSYGTQSSILIHFSYLLKGNLPHLSLVQNSSSNSYDLRIENVSVYDEGIYYCGIAERKFADVNGRLHSEFEYHYGNRRNHLLLESPLSEVTELNCNSWTLLFSMCSVCVFLSSLLSGACVYGLCHVQTTGFELNAEMLKAVVYKVDQTEKDRHQCEMSEACFHTEVTFRLLPSRPTYPYVKM